ncbi:MAG TPA: SRPBCC family protein [Cytophagales bacterium]|nr:SRPBCC family protein [Cytophagales bacterium]
METALIAKKSILINASSSEVWLALISPELIKKYLFGTETTSDWKVGSPITFRGEWEGKFYEDKGTIKKIIPNKLLKYTFWSSMSGKEDKPENYANVIYELESEGNQTLLTITQDNIATEQSREHSESNWGMVLNSIKKLLEEK